ncbi:RNA-binding post-transcriptional regulator cip1 [Schizosaccharomyces pombe]
MPNEIFPWKIRVDESRGLAGNSGTKKSNHEALSRLQSPLNSPKLQPIGSPQASRKTSGSGSSAPLYPKWSGALSLASSRAASPAPSDSFPTFGYSQLGGLENSSKGSALFNSANSIGTPYLSSRNSNSANEASAMAFHNVSPPSGAESSSESKSFSASGKGNKADTSAEPSLDAFNSTQTKAGSTANSNSTPVEPGEDTIPTAIVVKNIPFSLEKDTLLDHFKQLGIPRPYAFNYHYDNGIFRGLAFANFYRPEEAQVVVQTLNGYEINGRRLRVEWKRQLPAAEREKVEKAKKRQAEERRRKQQYKMFEVSFTDQGLNLNDTGTLETYSRLLLFAHQCIPSREITFETTSKDGNLLNAIRIFCLYFDLDYYARPNGEVLKLVVTHPNKKNTSVSQSQPASPNLRFNMPAPLATRFLQEHSLNGTKSAPITPPPSFAVPLTNQLRSIDDKIYGNESPLQKASTLSSPFNSKNDNDASTSASKQSFGVSHF